MAVYLRLWISVSVILTGLTAVSAEAFHDDPGRNDQSGYPQNEPIVSRNEAALLKETEEMASTDLSLAITTLKKAIDSDSSPALDFALGCFYYERDDARSAINALRQALIKMPAFHRARENLAKILFQEGDYAAAATEMAYLLDTNYTTKKELWKMLGHAYLKANKPMASEVAYRNALVYSPDDRELPILLIQTLLEQEKYSETRSLIARELAVTPLREELWKLYANIDLSSDRHMEALVRLECAYRLGIAGPEILVTLGDLYLEQGLADEAFVRYEHTTAMDRPPVTRLLNALEGFLYQNNFKEARTLLDALKTAQDAMTAEERMRQRYLTAKLAEEEGDLNGALQSYTELLRENPLDADSLLAAGYVLQKQLKFDEALVYYERVARISPEHEAKSLIRQAQIAVEKGEYGKAEPLLEHALEIRHEAYIERYLEQVRQMLE